MFQAHTYQAHNCVKEKHTFKVTGPQNGALISMSFCLSGSNSIPPGRKEGSRKSKERLGQKNKDVRVCIKTRKVRFQVALI